MAAALPGGDPLAAAIAAGETPSPELVAASGEEGTLPRWQAWAWLAACLLALAAVPFAQIPFRLAEHVSMNLSPDTLQAKRWYFWQGIVAVAIVAALVFWGFRNVLGKQSAFPTGALVG